MLEAHRSSTPAHDARSATSRRRGTRLRTVATAALAATVGLTAFAAPVDAHKKGKDDKKGTAESELDIEVSHGSMYAVVDQIGARGLWEQGFTGEGVNIAVIDTGVAPVEALADQVVATVDLSSDAGDPSLRYVDSYGHGTHMAGIIAGKTPGADPALAEQHPEWFLGVAPDAGIVSVKVGAYDGAVDVTQVIAGVDWVVDHADQLDIDVINLSYSSGSELKYEKDPLAYAVERAWNAGIVVVVAAGNDGKKVKQLSGPAYDPFVIAVAGAEIDKGKFEFADWTSTGDGKRDPDITAPGASIESLRVPGSYIDQEFPEGYVDEQIFKGSGSSQAAAVVSGAAALILDARPDLSPDEVKALLMAEGKKVAKAKDYGDAELVHLEKIVDAKIKKIKKSKWKPSKGDGSLELARGDAPLLLNGEPLTGDVTALGSEWIGDEWTGVRWSAGEWDGARWSAGEWMGVRWSNATWTGEAWMGVRWSSDVWSGVRWSDAVWDGARWSGVRWSDAHWDGARWSGVRWSDESWSGARWSGVRWSNEVWEGVRWSDVTWSSVGWG